jgi:ubiquinone/menaquinone biosynthesis C-methylase UbiE/uncharacterized membrane protein (DUF485 family)
MNTRLRQKQCFAWAIALFFVIGFFYHPVGVFTGAALGTWFAGTQRPARGFFWMMVFPVLFDLPQMAWSLARGSADDPLAYLGWTIATIALGVLPFTLHRMVSPQMPGWTSTLPLPVFALALDASVQPWLPASAADLVYRASSPLFVHVAGSVATSAPKFLILWFAATTIWAWNHEFRAARIRGGAIVFAVTISAVACYEVNARLSHTQIKIAAGTAWLDAGCLVAAILFSLWAMARSWTIRNAHFRAGTLRDLRSPATGAPLHLAGRALTNAAGERFPVRNGIADLRRPEDLTGDNKKYNGLYETIGGFYDDTQRAVSALCGFDRDAYVMSYLGKLIVKEGDAVLETSVGTGLNFKYLPRGTSLTGLDLSPEMLTNCRANIARWQLDADLFLGNAEHLPFADASFDVVFHVGGINFFNDRAQAIREMIRVAKPGSHLLIADETEEHVQAAYERGPITSFFYKKRKEPVTPPVDLVPKEMQDVRLEILNVIGKNRFYVLTFRKPAQKPIY